MGNEQRFAAIKLLNLSGFWANNINYYWVSFSTFESLARLQSEERLPRTRFANEIYCGVFYNILTYKIFAYSSHPQHTKLREHAIPSVTVEHCTPQHSKSQCTAAQLTKRLYTRTFQIGQLRLGLLDKIFTTKYIKLQVLT